MRVCMCGGGGGGGVYVFVFTCLCDVTQMLLAGQLKCVCVWVGLHLCHTCVVGCAMTLTPTLTLTLNLTLTLSLTHVLLGGQLKRKHAQNLGFGRRMMR